MCMQILRLLSKLLVFISYSGLALSVINLSPQTIHVSNEVLLYQAVQKANRSNNGTDIVLADGHYNITQRIQLTGSQISEPFWTGDEKN